MLGRMLTETVDLVGRRPSGETDALGNEIVEETVKRGVAAWLEPSKMSETSERGEQTTYGYNLFLAPGESLSWVDRVVWRGESYRVAGQPGIQPGGFLVDGYVRAKIVATKG